jgi:hypothetical protein
MYHTFYVGLSQNQQTNNIINKCNMYFQHLHMFWQVNSHSQEVSTKELQVLIAFKYTIVGSHCLNMYMHKIIQVKN